MKRVIIGALLVLLITGTLTAQKPEEGAASQIQPTVKVAGIVLKWIRTDKKANFRRAEAMIREAASAGAKIVCTTECFLDGYAIADKSIPLEAYRSLGEPIPDGEHFKRLARLADELDIHLVAGMLEAAGEARYNTAVLIGPDGALIGKYHKQKLGHEIPRNTPGTNSPVFSTPYGRLGLIICADRRFPPVVKTICSAGADFIICPSGGMFGSDRNDPIVQARSRENGRYIVFVHPAEFLVTAPDGSMPSRTILGDRLLIDREQEGSDVDVNKVFYFDLPIAPGIKEMLSFPILEVDQPWREVQHYTEARIVRMPEFDSFEEWTLYAERLRRQVLERVVYRGAARLWRERTTRAVWGETHPGGKEYHLRKLRFEAVPGLWVPAILYEPLELDGKVPVVLNVNGHDGNGKVAKYKQLRCINQAKRGMLALNVEWLGMGQLRGQGYGHYKMNQLNLCGTSGLAPFYLSMKRGLDILLAHEHADPERVAVAGLSGGGWQTITISALDTRVTLSNPVAGYGSFVTRVHHLPDLGDSEQTPVDLAAIADYTHLTAMLAPRHALLTYNAADNCCFKSAHTLPPLLNAAEPIYELLDVKDRLRTHVNHDPGTHNFEQENREALYSIMGAAFYHDESDYRTEEIPYDAELKTAAELVVELPRPNADFHSLALELSQKLPREPHLPENRDEAYQWQRERRDRLAEIVRMKKYEVTGEVVDKRRLADGSLVKRRRLLLGDDWTVPAVEISRDASVETVVVVADGGRLACVPMIEKLLEKNMRVIAVDPFYLGESRISHKAHLYALLVDSVSDRPLGIQAGQLASISRWLAGQQGGQPVKLAALGPRSSLITLVAGALETEAIGGLSLGDSMTTLRKVIERNFGVNQAPELFCFGLLEHFDILHLAAMVAPRPVSFESAGERAQKELGALAGWYLLMDSQHVPLR